MKTRHIVLAAASVATLMLLSCTSSEQQVPQKDTEVFQQLLSGMLEGNVEFRLLAAKTPVAREGLAALRRKFQPVKEQVDFVLFNFKDLVAAREAQAKALIDADALEMSLRPECPSQSLGRS